jgi:hypothetical protein
MDHTPERTFNFCCKMVEEHLRFNPQFSVVEQLLRMAPVFYVTSDALNRASEIGHEDMANQDPKLCPVTPFAATIFVTHDTVCILYEVETPDTVAQSSAMLKWRTADGSEAFWRAKCFYFQRCTVGWHAVHSMVHLFPRTGRWWNITLPVRNVSLVFANKNDQPYVDGFMDEIEKRPSTRPEGLRDLLHMTIAILSMTLDQCLYIDLPKHHIVMEAPRSFDQNAKRPKIPRSTERPRVRLVEPEAVQRIYPHQPGEKTGRTVTPHARRGHTKFLTHPRYKEAQGRRVVIRPTWVGDPEWEFKGVKYKVIHRGSE